MKATSLRIGNYLWLNYLENEADASIIQVEKINKFTSIQIDKKILTPIPLTEEWLVKTGMFKNSKNSYSEIDKKNNENNNIPLFEIDIISGMFFHKRTGTRLKTVHHYQNLYFALTNKE
ncbi:MAG: hypothetical protein GY755_08150, partial [Chloroflexi bacterium]|nr:hypothetical protein [Chloroflexota bacterium]